MDRWLITTCWTPMRPRAAPGRSSARALVALLCGRELLSYPTRSGYRTRSARLQPSPLERLVQHPSMSPGPLALTPDGDVSNREVARVLRETQAPQHTAAPLCAGAELLQKAGGQAGAPLAERHAGASA